MSEKPKTYPWQPDWVVSPGWMLAEELALNNLTPRTFAASIGLSVETIEGLLAGTTRITEEMAERISRVFSVSPQFWLNLEKMYRDGLKARKRDASHD